MDTLPTVGTWYESSDGDCYVVVALHAERGTIEYGTLNGTADEMDLDEWSAMDLREIEPPEEWHGSMDDFLATRRGESG
jgi:hypothetical protein